MTAVWQALELQVLEKCAIEEEAVSALEDQKREENLRQEQESKQFESTEDDGMRARFAKLPPMPTLMAQQISLESIAYVSPSSLKTTSYALNKHMDRSRIDVRSNDATSELYWSAYKKVQKTGVFDIDCEFKDYMTAQDRRLLIRACHVLIIRGVGQEELDELASVLANCWSASADGVPLREGSSV